MTLAAGVLLSLMALPLPGAGPNPPVVVYVALDRAFAEPILDAYQTAHGVEIRAVYDTESNKTVGLVNRIRFEQHRPRCDVFWNNEIVNTLRLKNEGLLQPCAPSNAAFYPAQYKDPQGCWYGFAARARVLIVNNDLVPEGSEPGGILDLIRPEWKGRVGIARPLFGTTASHVACLFAVLGETRAGRWLTDLKRNDVQILPGNRGCAQRVAGGHLPCALTDTDDAMLEIAAGKPVRIVYLDAQPGGLGTLFIPNTLSVIAGCPNPQGAAALINSLLSVDTERRLAEGPSAQIPLNIQYPGSPRVKTPVDIPAMNVDFAEAARHFDTATDYIKAHFLY